MMVVPNYPPGFIERNMRPAYIDDRVRLMAYVRIPGINWPVYAEIDEADGQTRTARIHVPGHLHTTIPFDHIDSVALVQGTHTLEAYGRPPAASVPEWIQYREVNHE